MWIWLVRVGLGLVMPSVSVNEVTEFNFGARLERQRLRPDTFTIVAAHRMLRRVPVIETSNNAGTVLSFLQRKFERDTY